MASTQVVRARVPPGRAHAIMVAATVGSIRRRQQDFLADPRSVLDRPVLAETADPLVAAFVVAYDAAVEALGECTPDSPRRAAWAPSAAHAAEYAASQADQHARWLARHGVYPHLRVPLDVRGLDLIEEARASLELAAHARSGAVAAGRPSSPNRCGSGSPTCSSRRGKRCLMSLRRYPPR